MSPARLLAVARKEVIQLRRDPRSLALAFLLPLVLLMLFGYAISWDVRDISTGILDQDRSPRSRELIDAFTASGYFRIDGWLDSPAQIEPAMERGTYRMILVIPPGFERKLAGGAGAVGSGPVAVQAILDGGDANTATIASAYARGVVASLAQSWGESRATPSGGAPAAGSPISAGGTPIEVRSRVWYNEELESRNMIVPGLVAVIMMIIAAMLTSLTIAREWERGTMEQLAATPVTRFEVVAGKLLPYLAIGLFDVVTSTLLGVAVFDVPFRGDPLLLFVLATFFLIGSLGLGAFISAVARSQLLATQVAMLATFLPAFLLSGFMFAISVMPAPLRAITYLVPARYFLEVTRGIFLKGVGLGVLRWPAALMVLYAAVGLTLAVAAFRKEIE